MPDFEPCPIAPMVDLIFARWTTHVLWVLSHDGRMRFTELHRRIPDVTPKVLTQRLRQLERDGLIAREYFQELPPRVEYEITALGRTLQPVFTTLHAWSDSHLDEVAEARRSYDAAAL